MGSQTEFKVPEVMTVRDHFALAALKSAFADPYFCDSLANNNLSFLDAARMIYNIADAMVEVRNHDRA